MADNWQLKAVLSANAQGMIKALGNVNKMAKTSRKYLLDVGSSAVNLADRVGLPAAVISSALAGFSLVGIKQAVTNFAALSGEIDDNAQRMGVSTDEFQRLKYMAEQSGAPIESLAGSMGKLNKGIAMAAAGKNKDLAELFKRAGISMRDANGQLRTGADLLPEIADLFQRNQNAAVRARMGNAIFGKSWSELAPLLNEGDEGIRKLTERYKALGLTIDGQAIKAGADFDDQLADLRGVMASYGNTISAKLLPVMAPMLEKTIQWAVANRELITTKVSKFIGDVALALEQVDWNAVVSGVESFVAGVKDVVSWVGGAKNALILLAVVMNAQTIVATIGLIGSLGRLGLALGAVAMRSIPAAVSGMSTLAMSMVSANAGGVTMLGTVGLLIAKLGALAAAGAAGFAVGTWLNDNVINPAVEKMSGVKGQTLGGWIYDATHRGESDDATKPITQEEINAYRAKQGKPPLNGAAGSRPSLVAPAAQVKATGQIDINFNGAPPGTRVEQVKGGGDVPIRTDVGYRSYATGMP